MLPLRASGQASKDSVYLFPEVQARFSYDITAMRNFMADNLRYPEAAQNAGQSGRVWISFIVNKDGRLSDISVLKRLNNDLDSEALRVVKLMPAWIPARQGGEAVRSKYNLPVDFRLKRAEKGPDFPKNFFNDMLAFVYSKRLPESAYGSPSEPRVKFNIDASGNCSDWRVVKSGGPQVDSELIRFLRLQTPVMPALDSFGDPMSAHFTVSCIFTFGMQKNWLEWRQFMEEDTSVDQQPFFHSGSVGLSKYMDVELRPEAARGVVIARFRVSENGDISEITIKKSLVNYADKEAIRVIRKMPPWLPAQKNGKPVAAYVDLPVFFEPKGVTLPSYTEPGPLPPMPNTVIRNQDGSYIYFDHNR